MIRRLIVTCLLLLVLPFTSSIASASAESLTVFKNTDVQLLNNRFRLDYSVDKATFLLYRDPGSPAAILVRPDGSKIYAWQLPENVTWLETDELDIVTIVKPMPGPWQAVAQNKGRNRVRVLSDVVMETDPIPAQLYQGERIKMTARLLNKGERFDLEAMIPEAMMSISLLKDNPEQEENSRIRPFKLGDFLDDGKKYDEVPEDGVLTTEIMLDVPAGKYELIINTLNEVFTRAKRQIILVYPHPIRVDVTGPNDNSEQAQMTVNVDSDEIDPSSVVIDGMVYNNVGWEEDFRIFTEQDNSVHALPTPSEQGRYRIKGTLYANTISGREIVVELDEEDFVILPPPPPPLEPVVVQQPVEEGTNWLMIILVIFSIVTLAGLVFLFIWWRKRKAFQAALQEARASEQKPSGDEPAMAGADELKMPSE